MDSCKSAVYGRTMKSFALWKSHINLSQFPKRHDVRLKLDYDTRRSSPVRTLVTIYCMYVVCLHVSTTCNRVTSGADSLLFQIRKMAQNKTNYSYDKEKPLIIRFCIIFINFTSSSYIQNSLINKIIFWYHQKIFFYLYNKKSEFQSFNIEIISYSLITRSDLV